MLTGTGSTMSEWDPALLRLLARDHRLVLFDYPGVGRSGPWQGRLLRLARRRGRRPDARDPPAAGGCPRLVDGRLRRPAPGHRPPAARLAPGPRRDQPRRQPRRARHAAGAGNRQRARPLRSRDPARALPARAARPRAGASCAASNAPAAAARSPTTSTSRPPPCAGRSRPRTPGCAATATTASSPASPSPPWPQPAPATPSCRRSTCAGSPPASPAPGSRVFAGAHAFLFQSRRPFARAVDRLPRRLSAGSGAADLPVLTLRRPAPRGRGRRAPRRRGSRCRRRRGGGGR